MCNSRIPTHKTFLPLQFFIFPTPQKERKRRRKKNYRTGWRFFWPHISFELLIQTLYLSSSSSSSDQLTLQSIRVNSYSSSKKWKQKKVWRFFSSLFFYLSFSFDSRKTKKHKLFPSFFLFFFFSISPEGKTIFFSFFFHFFFIFYQRFSCFFFFHKKISKFSKKSFPVFLIKT